MWCLNNLCRVLTFEGGTTETDYCPACGVLGSEDD